MVLPHVFFVRIESGAFAYVTLAGFIQTEAIIWEFESYNTVFEVLAVAFGIVELV